MTEINAPERKKTIFSAIQHDGTLKQVNYLGALSNVMI